MLCLLAISLSFLLKLLTCLAVVLAVLYCLRLFHEPRNGKCRCRTDLTGKVVLITGGNTGIGLETARELANRGAKVIIASRNTNKSLEAIGDIKERTGNPDVECLYLDLSKFDSIKQFAADFNKRFSRLDILVNNAGCAAAPRKLTADGIDFIMQVNYLGPFLLTNLLLDTLKRHRPSRIIMLSSKFHEYAKLNLDDFAHSNTVHLLPVQYANSKLCNILWAKALARRLPEGVTVNVVHPGVVKTEIFNNFSTVLTFVILLIVGLFFKTAEEGAQTSIHLCLDPELEHVSGEYFADCVITKPSTEALNQELAEKVWGKKYSVN